MKRLKILNPVNILDEFYMPITLENMVLLRQP
jgi:hypothetical protein